MYEYRATINKIIDGDTVDVDIDLGFNVILKDERVRIIGIDTPESRTSDPVEKLFGLASKHRLQELLKVGSKVILKTEISKTGEDMKGKFGRILGDFIVEYNGKEKLITDIMIEEYLAVEYFGQSKDEIQDEHLQNREILLSEGVISEQDYQNSINL